MAHRGGWGRTARAAHRFVRCLAVACGLAGAPAAGAAQEIVNAARESILVTKGQTALIVQPVALQRMSIADPEIAEVFAVSPQEILVNGKEIGSTSLLLWDRTGGRRLYTVEVLPDTQALRTTLQQVYPDEPIQITATGRSIIVSGEVANAAVAQRIVDVAKAAGFEVIDNLQVPAAPQIMLHVRIAEVTRNALRELGTQIRAVRFGDAVGAQETAVETSSEGLLQLSLLDADLQIEAVIEALQTNGQFRSLAEPNLLARDNEEASFLAGGEFPFPVVQAGQFSSVTVVWKEFGVRLRFRPILQASGVIRLEIAPEVSSLDFTNSLRLSGFVIPSLLTRRAQTEVELRDGQYLAIAGLLDNSMEQNVTKIPYLGDIPVLGELFRSRDNREGRTELLVLVTPRLVRPSDAPLPVPTGEPESWQWSKPLRLPPPIRR